MRDTHPEVGVVVSQRRVTQEPAYMLALSLRAAATGRAYLLKERVSDLEQLAGAIRTVAGGGSVMDPKVVEALVARKTPAAKTRPSTS